MVITFLFDDDWPIGRQVEDQQVMVRITVVESKLV